MTAQNSKMCAQRCEKDDDWVFYDVSKVSCTIRESNTGLTSIEIGISKQLMSRFCSWAIGWTWWGPGRARTWRITSILWRLGPVHKRHIGARRHSGYRFIYGLVCMWDVGVWKFAMVKQVRWMLERWKTASLANLYTLRILRYNRTGSHFCMHSCSPSRRDPRSTGRSH